MAPQTTTGRIAGLLSIIIAITIIDSYVPHELTLPRTILSYVLLSLMALVGVVTLRAVLKDF